MHLPAHKIRQYLSYEFSYNLSRKYPFKWFKWVAIFGMFFLFAIFTVLNLATIGYDLQPMSTTDPNSTETKQYWFNNVLFTWGDDKLHPKCQKRDMPVGSHFMTTNKGLTYTLKSISSQLLAQNESSLSYFNNTLQNCGVKSINVFLRKADDSVPPKSQWWSWMLSYAEAEAECEVTNEAGLFTLRFSTRYETLSKTYDYVIIDNYTTHASVWWGTRLLDNYFNGIQTVISKASNGAPTKPLAFSNCQLAYSTEAVESIKENKLFKLWHYFLASDGSIEDVNTHKYKPDQVYNNESNHLSRPITEGLFFAKTFYSLILVDLGEVQTPNLLLDSELLRYALDPPDNFNRQNGGPLHNKGLDWWYFRGISPPGQLPEESNSILMSQSYEKFKDQMGPLGTRRASISSQYTCSIPVLKAKVGLILSILVTNFVLLQTVWTILKFVAEQIVSASDSTAMYCDGCIAKGHGLVNMIPHHDPLRSGGVTSISRSVSKSDSTRGLLQKDHLEDENLG